MSDSGTYIYAVGRELSADRMTSVRGLGGAELRLVEQNGLVAVVSTVGLDEFGESGLRRNLEDLNWLEEVARGHDEVVRSAAEAAPTSSETRLKLRGTRGCGHRRTDWVSTLPALNRRTATRKRVIAGFTASSHRPGAPTKEPQA